MPTRLFSRTPTHRHRLDNGLTVLLREDRDVPVVAIITHVRAGYLDEPDEWTGISHVVEHMFFKGTPRFGPGELGRETKALGGVLNASTGYDRTFYYTVLPAHAFERALEMQADALQHSVIDGDELARELRVIIQEAKRKLDSPAAVAAEALYETMFDVHRLRRWRIGTEAGLAALSRADVMQWLRASYRPERTVLSIAGAIDARRALAYVERLYGDFGGEGEPPTPGPAEPVRHEFRYRELGGDTRRTRIEWGWRTPGPLHPDTPLLDVLAVVLGQGRASRLYREVREVGLASQIAARNATHGDTGVFGVSAVTEPADAAAAAQAMAAAVRSASHRDVRADELDRARSVAEAGLLHTLETVEGQATLLAEWEALGDWHLFEAYFDRIRSASASDVARVAATYLDVDAATLLIHRPATQPAVAVSAAEMADALRRVPPSASSAPAAAAVPHLPALPAARVQRIHAHGVDDGVARFDIDEGCACVVLPRTAVPLVSIRLCFPGGAAQEDERLAGFTTLMARAALQGTSARTAAAIALEAETMGGALSASVEAETLSWSLTVPARHLEAGLALLCDVAFAPIFPAAETATERKVALARLQQIRDDMYAFPIRLALEAAFAGDPYGLTLEHVERALPDADPLRLRDWHARIVRAGQPLLVVAGDAQPAVVADLAARLLPAGGAAPARPASPAWAARGRVREARRESAQTAFAIAFPGPARNETDALALRLLAHAVSGLGGPLFEDLRSRRSLAYTVAAFPLSYVRGGAFLTYIATSPEREEEARTSMFEHIARLREETLDATHVDRARRYALGSRDIRRQTNAARVDELAGALLLGRGLDEIRDYEARVLAVTPDTIRAAAQRWLDPELAVEGIVRGTGGGR